MDSIKLATSLPQEIHGITFCRNSHYLDLTDKDGNVAHLLPTGVVKYCCTACNVEFMMLSKPDDGGIKNYGDLQCPICLGNAKPKWGNIQLSFIPENESDFHHGR